MSTNERKNRREREKENRENEILQAAKELFLEKGFNGSTMDDIAQRSEFSKKTIYSYFLSKEEILIRVFMIAVEESHSLYKEVVEQERSGYKKLYAYSLAVYECYRNKPEYIGLFDIVQQIMQKDVELSDKSLMIRRSTAKLSIELVEEVFKLGIRDKTLRTDLDPKIAVTYFMVTIQQIVRLFLLSTRYDRDDYLTAVDYFLSGLISRS